MIITPISNALGAEISEIDLSVRLSNNQTGKLYDAFLKYCVLFFREHSLSATQVLEFSKTFGPPAIYPFIQGLPEVPEVIEIIKTETDENNFGGSWHSDTSYMHRPAKATLLYAKEVPDFGGDTLFCNTNMAYEQLSEGMKKLLSDLRGVNSSEKGYQGGRATGMNKLNAMKGTYKKEAKSFESEHPVIRTHPDTGKKSLYINESHTYRFKNMSEEESTPLINYLCDHMIKPEFTCRFRWREGSLAIWDNRTTLHNAINDYQKKRRHMQRITIEGCTPR
ncbi:MAG: taurine dioxygenase [Rhodospirillaceae bacterium]|nr:taurine dioxygenase [Rhodospirillaceae bacterium]